MHGRTIELQVKNEPIAFILWFGLGRSCQVSPPFFHYNKEIAYDAVDGANTAISISLQLEIPNHPKSKHHWFEI